MAGRAVLRAVRSADLAAYDPHEFDSRTPVRARFTAGGYSGASSTKKSLKEWTPISGSPDRDQLDDLGSLRARSRDLARNAPLAVGAVNTVVTNVVGTGMTLQSQIDRDLLGLSEAEADAWEHDAERIWAIAADELDIEGEQKMGELEELVFRSTLDSGDILMVRRFVDDPSTLLRTRLQFFEADRVSNPNQRMDTPTLAGGVEVDRDGRPLRYWVADTHPGDFLRRPTRWSGIPVRGERSGMRQSKLLYKRLRPGQRRGIPYLAPVIELLKQLERYSEAEIQAAVISSFFTVFVKTEGGDEAGLPDVIVGEVDAAAVDAGEIAMGPGVVADLKPNEDVEFANPGRPNAAFDPFVLAVLRQIGVALELPFEVLVKHFESSYSAARAALLQAWKFFSTRRYWLASNFNQVVYEWVITEAVLRGLLPAPGFLENPLIRRAWLGSRWIGDAQGQIDPYKEIQAAELRVDMGVSTLAEETAQITGGNWERNHRQRVKESRMRREAGLDATKAATPPPAPPTFPSGPPEPDEEDEQ